MLKVLDLFSGVGGIHLGMKAVGCFETAYFSEINLGASRVLARRFPDIPNLGDVRNVRNIQADVVAGGFPCQDISVAKNNALGLAGSRSGLWFEMERVIGETNPVGVLIENVAILRKRGLNHVLAGLARLGYNAEWQTISASSVGAPHRRQRLFVIAYRNRPRRSGLVETGCFTKNGQWRWRGEEDLQAIAANPFTPGKRWPTPLLCGVDARSAGRAHRLTQIGNSVCVPVVTQIASVLAQRLNAL